MQILNSLAGTRTQRIGDPWALRMHSIVLMDTAVLITALHCMVVYIYVYASLQVVCKLRPGSSGAAS
jgi:hypothetical protein